MERMTPADPFNRKPAPSYEPEPLDGDQTVFGACGDITTTRRKKRGNGDAVETYRAERGVFRQRFDERRNRHANHMHLLYPPGALSRSRLHQPRFGQGLHTCVAHFTIRRLEDGVTGEKHYVVAFPWTSAIVDQGPHATFRPVAPNGISRFFARNKSNTTMIDIMVVLLVFQHHNRQKRRAESFSLREKKGYIGARLDGRFQTDALSLHAEALAALKAATSQDSTTTLRGHTSTETVALGALALIRLISALHIDSFSWSKTIILW